jgi:hypothetical protein
MTDEEIYKAMDEARERIARRHREGWVKSEPSR